VRRSRFAADLVVDFEFVSKTTRGTACLFNATLQHVDHLVRGPFTDSLYGLRYKVGQHVAVLVFNTCYKEGLCVDAAVDKRSISADKFIQRHIVHTQAQRRHRVEMARYTNAMRELHYVFGFEALQQLRGNAVDRPRHSLT